MAKQLAVVASLLVALLALSEAATYTTITTTVVEEDNPSQRRCSEQVQRQSLRHCSMYLSQRGSPYEVAEMEDANPTTGQSQHMQQCCQELRNMDQQCRCEAIREVVRRQQQGGEQWEGEQMQQMVQKAQSLPQRCNFQQPKQCQIRAVCY